MNRLRKATPLFLAAVLGLAGCSSVASKFIGFGQSGFARLIDASNATTGSLALEADGAVINSGVSSATPIGVYSKVGATSIKFDVNTGAGTSDVVPAINLTIAPSTNYTIVLEGEPSGSNYMAFGFQDTNALNNAATVRFKVNNAAPNLSTPVDVYVWLPPAPIPTTPTVGGLALNQDSGSTPSHPGDSYIPTQGSSTFLPSGTYNIAIVPAGGTPNGSTDLFDGHAPMTVNISYSLTIEDLDVTPNHISVLSSIDEPFQGANQTAIAHRAVRVH